MILNYSANIHYEYNISPTHWTASAVIASRSDNILSLQTILDLSQHFANAAAALKLKCFLNNVEAFVG